MPDDTVDEPRQIIADLQRQLAQYRTERDEALAQQNAVTEVLQLINTSPGDLTPVFETMLEKALRLCGAAYGDLLRYDGRLFHLVAAVHDEPQIGERRRDQLGFQPTPDGLLDRIVRGEDVVFVEDARESLAYRSGVPEFRRLIDAGGYRSVLNVALRKDRVLFGDITILRKEVRPFTDRQIALLQNFAAQAVIAMENARLLTETREALEQQTATAEVLQVINSSPGDLAPVFDAMLEKALRLCGAAYGNLLGYADGQFQVMAVAGGAAAGGVGHSFRPVPDTILSVIADGDNPAFVEDLLNSETYRAGRPRFREMVVREGFRSVLNAALRKESKLLGVISIFRKEPGPFTDKQIALLQNFAAQAVIAMENARLITETREALEQQTATAEVLGVINASPGDLAPVFDTILEKAHALCGVETGSLQLYDGEGFHAVATRGMSEEYAERLRRPRPPGGGSSRLIQGEPLVQVMNMSEASSFPSAAAREGLGTVLFVPLRKDGTLLGLIAAGRREVRPFSDKQIALLQNFAAQAVIAMENARLITETREALEQQTATAEVLQVINSSPGDLVPVFEAMLDKALRLCSAAFGVMWIRDGEVIRAGAIRGATPEFAEFLTRERVAADSPMLVARAVRERSMIHVADVKTSEPYRQGVPLAVISGDQAGIRTILMVPLSKDDDGLGLFTIYRREVRPFSEKEIALVRNFAAQAVIAMENARLMTETREALEQQTATAEVLQVINSSPGNLAPVFAAMLEKAMRLCEATFGTLTRIDGDHFHSVASHNVPLALIEAMRQPRLVVPGNAHYRLLEGEDVVQVADVTAEEIYRSGNPSRRALAELGGARTVLWAALRNDTTLLGAFVIFRQEVRPFSDKQIALLQNFAAQAVIAMENARLITETRDALEQQTATAEVLQVINSSPGDLAPVFDAILEKARSLCGVAYGSLELYDGENFRAVATIGFSDSFADLVEQGYRAAESPDTRALIEGERFAHILDLAETDAEMTRSAVALDGHRTLLCVPLRREGQLLGMISSARKEVRAFSEKEIALLENFAAQAVIAMENARLLGELRARTDEIAGWNKELEARVAAQLAELERTGKLRRFLAPQLADLIVAQGDESILESHRREIVVVFCDLRGFTGFAERAEPEEVMALLRDYHAAMGPIVAAFEGTLDHYAGDGIMVFFNDPVPTPDPARRAIEMAAAMREAAQDLLRSWRRQGHDIGFGVGISQGYATLGQIGFAERMDYTAIGTVTNLAARLCAEAKDGQILVSRRVAIAVEDSATLEEVGDLSLKGLSQAVAVYNVVPQLPQGGRHQA